MAFIVKDAVHEPLYCIVPYFNPWRWKTREKHTMRAIKHFHDSGAVIVLVELAFNQRDHAFADSGLHGTQAECSVSGGGGEFKHTYIPLRTRDELWLKENSINVAVQRALPYDWKYVCWLDSDIHFLRPNWVGETIHKLQHYDWLQMFSHARDLGPNYEMLPETYPHANGTSFMEVFRRGGVEGLRKAYGKNTGYYYGAKPWPGLAWACTREAWDAAGGLLDFAIWGGGDWHMAHALVRKTDGMMHSGLNRNYKKLVTEWYKHVQETQYVRMNVGVMEGSVLHNWHGRKTERGYAIKHRLLAQIGFDPTHHLKRDFQGLFQLHDDNSESFVQLRAAMRAIAKERDEDSSYTGIDKEEQGH
jgi:hypothetical protein